MIHLYLYYFLFKSPVFPLLCHSAVHDVSVSLHSHVILRLYIQQQQKLKQQTLLLLLHYHNLFCVPAFVTVQNFVCLVECLETQFFCFFVCLYNTSTNIKYLVSVPDHLTETTRAYVGLGQVRYCETKKGSL